MCIKKITNQFCNLEICIVGGVLASMKPGQRRHVAWTFNHVTDITCAYLDGYEVHCEQQNAGSVRVMDCGMNNSETAFVGLNYRTGGARQAATPVQDWRYYRQALSADQVRKVAYDSVDGAGKNLRTCALASEGFDTRFVDMAGHHTASGQSQCVCVYLTQFRFEKQNVRVDQHALGQTNCNCCVRRDYFL